MRLIDANKLGLHFNDWQYAQAPNDKTGHEPKEYASHDMQLMVYETIGEAMRGIDEAPTVEAIPIDYIENWLKELRKSLRNVQMSIPDYNDTMNKLDEFERVIHMMIYNWREENVDAVS